jgi:hypothetical protein
MPRIYKEALRNAQAKMLIGICRMSGKPALYVEENNRRRIYAEFVTFDKAYEFLEKLQKWDEMGGNDGN